MSDQPDPSEVMGIMRKKGVVFTRQQVRQVKARVKADDTLGAQKLILGEMHRQIGEGSPGG